MTVKDEYNKMKSYFRIWNNCSNWDDTPYIFFGALHKEIQNNVSQTLKSRL